MGRMHSGARVLSPLEVRGRSKFAANIGFIQPNPSNKPLFEVVQLLACCFCKETFSSKEELRGHEMLHLKSKRKRHSK